MVIVAINHTRHVMTDVDKGSERTVIVFGLVGPKRKTCYFKVRLCLCS